MEGLTDNPLNVEGLTANSLNVEGLTANSLNVEGLTSNSLNVERLNLVPKSRDYLENQGIILEVFICGLLWTEPKPVQLH